MSKQLYQVTKEERRLINQMIWRSGFLQGSFNMVKMQGQGYLYALIPMLNHYYGDDPERKREAMVRSASFFNTNLAFAPFIMGLNMSMEKQKSEDDASIEESAILALKTSLMGPLAGIGDSFMLNTVRVIAAGIGVGMAADGNIAGLLLFLAAYLIPFYIIKYNVAYLGFTMGSSFIHKLFEDGLLKQITKAAAIVGIIMVGALVSQMVNLNITTSFAFGKTTIELQKILDSILPGLLSILLVFVLRAFIKKGIKAVWLVLGIIVCSILLALFGIV